MSSERWRLFVAVPIGEELRRDLAAAVEEWKKRPDLARLRWTDPASWHVTLAFLGDVSPARLEAVRHGMHEVASGHHRVSVPTGGLGGFPATGRARVAWYAIGDPNEDLEAISRALCGRFGVPRASEFRPHISVGRARGQPLDLRYWVCDAVCPRGRLDVERLELMRSRLSRAPAIYELAYTVPLSGNVLSA